MAFGRDCGGTSRCRRWTKPTRTAFGLRITRVERRRDRIASRRRWQFALREEAVAGAVVTAPFLVRARLRRDLPAAALAPLLVPAESGRAHGRGAPAAVVAVRRRAERKRDFLWRETGPGAFLALAPAPARRPARAVRSRCKALRAGAARGRALAFSLRANPAVATAPAAPAGAASGATS